MGTGGSKGRKLVGLQQLRRIVARNNPPNNKAAQKDELTLKVLHAGPLPG